MDLHADSKAAAALPPSAPASAPAPSRPRPGFLQVVCIWLFAVATVYFFFLPRRPLYEITINYGSDAPVQAPVAEAARVPLEAHIMSKCPDAEFCLRKLVLPAMQRVVDKVDFTLSFIGTPTANDGVDCMHGPPECLGNIIELCAAELYPDPKIYLGFTMCLTREYKHIPEKNLLEDCALEHGIDFEQLNECASNEDGSGLELLRNSVLRSSEAGVTTSCTVRLNDEIYCIRDGGKWKDCPNGSEVNNLVIAVEKLYRSS